MADGRTEMSFMELNAQSNRCAHAMRRLGLVRGDVIATLFGNSPEVFVIGWAAKRTGLYSTSISNKLSDKDISYILADSGARLLLVSPAYADLAVRAARENPGVRIFCIGDGSPFQDWSEVTRVEQALPVADESAGTDLL
ncbi:MAG: acyl-CoA synthetase, partial [Alphaproteobacteria bacterium HGW-Alphaproteobacteria-5]